MVNKSGCTVAARELSLYAINDRKLYSDYAKPVISNLARKLAKGDYDTTKAKAAWHGYMAASAKKYGVDHSTGEKDGLAMFPPVTRDLAIDDVMSHYDDVLQETAETIRKDMLNRKHYDLAAIKYLNGRGGGYFFSRDTMRFFGDTMRNFAVRYVDGKIYVERIAGRSNIGKQWEFDPESGDLV